MKNFTLLMLASTLNFYCFAQEIVIYDTFDAFEASINENCADTALTFEDFEGILQGLCNVNILPDPNQECFAADELEEGFTIEGMSGDGMIAFDTGEFGDNPIPLVLPNNSEDTVILRLSPNVNAVAFSLWGGVVEAEIKIYDANDILINEVTLPTPNGQLSFFSVVSTVPIFRIEYTGAIFTGQLYFGAMNCTNLNVSSQELQNITIFPNPASNFITINNPANLEIKNIYFTDVTGKRIKMEYNTTNEISLNDMQTGVYFITIETIQGRITKKVLVK